MRHWLRNPVEWTELPGTAGNRYSAADVARGLGVDLDTVVNWIKKGWMRAAHTTRGRYLIRHRAIRRALRDNPQVAAVAMRAWHRHIAERLRLRSEIPVAKDARRLVRTPGARRRGRKQPAGPTTEGVTNTAE